MLFQKLVEQHPVHLIIAHTISLSFLIAHHHVGIDLFHILSDQPKLPSVWINFLFVTKDDLF